jgi:hypothetical protein
MDPSSFTSNDQHPGQRIWPHVDTSSSDSSDMRATNLLSLPHMPESCCHQTLKANASHFNIAALCDPHYHCGTDDLSILTIPDICACGYMLITSDNVMLCFNDIISMHSKVLESWTTPVPNTVAHPLSISLKRLFQLFFQSLTASRLQSWCYSMTIFRTFLWCTSFLLCPSMRSISGWALRVSAHLVLAPIAMRRSAAP